MMSLGDQSTSKPTLALPVINNKVSGVGRSRMAKWRAFVLIFVHVLIIVHVTHWLVTGETISPVEPAEAMFTINDGKLNAGFLFFVSAILATLIFGRFLCGWGCHFVAYQDICSWLLKKMRIKPKPFRSRLPMLGPLVLALYMFVWPSVYRLFVGADFPLVTNHLLKTGFWDTFPGPVITIVTILVCGFGIVYVLGSKGFCTYACPYGAFFGLADRVSPGRLLVTDDCSQCGHCTAICSSNVRVHEEVDRFKMVVDPGCMKCMDCVSICPEDALYFGFARPAIAVTSVKDTPRRKVSYDFNLWEECLMLGIGIAALLVFRGLYEKIPLLMSMGLAAITAYSSIKLLRLALQPNLKWQHWQLKRGGRLSWLGCTFAVFMVAWLSFTAHSAAVQYQAMRGGQELKQLALGDEIWLDKRNWIDDATDKQKALAKEAEGHLRWADRWGLMSTTEVLRNLTLLSVATGRIDEALQYVRQVIDLAPDRPEPLCSLGNVLRKSGRMDDAANAYRDSLARDVTFKDARRKLLSLYLKTGQFARAEQLCREAMDKSPGVMYWPTQLARLYMQNRAIDNALTVLKKTVEKFPEAAEPRVLMGIAYCQLQNWSAGFASFEKAIEIDGSYPDAHYNLGMAFLGHSQIDQAVSRLEKAVELAPNVGRYRYNLAVALFSDGRPEEALPHIQKAVELEPTDPLAHGFAAVVLKELGDWQGADKANAQARKLGLQIDGAESR